MVASAIAYLVPSSAGTYFGKADEPLPIAIPAKVHAITSPDSVLSTHDGSNLLFAGKPSSPTAVTAPIPAKLSPSTPDPLKNYRPPLVRDPWLNTQLPLNLPRLDPSAQPWHGLLKVTVSEQGLVASAVIAESCGNSEVDQATLDRIKRERLDPAYKILPDGSHVPQSYANGLLQFRWGIPPKLATP